MLSFRVGEEATRFPVGDLASFLGTIALRDLAYLLLPRESRSFPTNPF